MRCVRGVMRRADLVAVAAMQRVLTAPGGCTVLFVLGMG